MCGFTAQLVEHRTGITEVTGSNPVKALIFFRLLPSNCLNWKIYWDDDSSLWCTYCFGWCHRTSKCYFCIFKMLGVLWRLMQMLNLMLLQVAPALHITEENNALPLHCPDRWPTLLQFQDPGQPQPLIIAHSQGKGLEQVAVHTLNLQVHWHNQELKKSLLNPMHHLQWQIGWVCDFRTIQSYFCDT